ncbi:fimbrial biogenesis chaperone (plasmid) [Rahnella variigena]|uniref:fimbrial biogenesis chaperone n=1 Tax=Rahnella variigena TaxID=574964 RepID=UPI003CF288BE
MWRLSVGLSLLLLSCSSIAGVEIGGNRVIYDAGAKQAVISVSNPDDRPYLIQSWVDKSPEAGDGDETFITTPPLFRLEPHSQNSVRIVYTGKSLPSDHESMMWLSIKSVPSTERDDANRLFITVKTVMKLFYRPRGLKGDPATAYEKLNFSRRGEQIYVSNPTPYYISLYELVIGGFHVKTPPTLPPYKEQTVAVPKGLANTVSWRAINDFGGVTDVRNAKL